mgnify:CR=1 FL=1
MAQPMYFLAIETSCDETAAAVFTDEPRIIAHVVASQTPLHERFRGVVPEVAARAHLRQLLPVIHETLTRAQMSLADIGAIAVVHTPGLAGALLIGVSAAKMLAVVRRIPLIAVNHIEAHIYACQLVSTTPVFPCVGLVASGGHTVLFECRDALHFRVLGATLDDAAGEAFDKAAALLGLGFPGGPAIERLARSGNPRAFALPRAFLKDERLDFSFSGLKTALLYTVRDLQKLGRLDEVRRADLAASFQAAIVDVLVAKCRQALERTGLRPLCVGGGVAANTVLRRALAEMTGSLEVRLVVPPLEYCTDNAAMAAMAVETYRAGLYAPADLDAEPTYRPVGC